jgi:hypothetical protein
MFAGTENHVDPGEAHENFSAGIGNLFGDEEDFWG